MLSGTVLVQLWGNIGVVAVVSTSDQHCTLLNFFFCRLAGGLLPTPGMAYYDVLSPSFQNNTAILQGQAVAAAAGGGDVGSGSGGTGGGGSGGGGRGKAAACVHGRVLSCCLLSCCITWC